MRSKSVIGSIIIVGSLVALVAGSTRSNSVSSISVSALRVADDTPHSFVGQTLRVVGTVTDGKVRRVSSETPQGVVNINYFSITENDKVLQVEYRDALPDTFRAGGPVQVDGRYTAPGKIVADHVFTKCPSKYDDGKSAHPATEGKANPHEKA
jgi:cytochrome c-type biogenesis protein CcmE